MDERKYYTNLDNYESALQKAEQRRLLKQAFPKPETNQVSLYRKFVSRGSRYISSAAHQTSAAAMTLVSALREPECETC